MACPSRVELTVSGILNGAAIIGRGTLAVDCTAGTKSGSVTFQTSPPSIHPVAHSIVIQTGRCFVGAKPLGAKQFLGPFELLGREFISLRVTTVRNRGAVSVGEGAVLTGDTLRSDFFAVGDLTVPALRALGPIRELITVSGPDTMVGQGRYSFLTARGRRVGVRYTHFYRSLKPHRGMGRLKGQQFLLRANVSTKLRGRTVTYHSRSTIRRL